MGIRDTLSCFLFQFFFGIDLSASIFFPSILVHNIYHQPRQRLHKICSVVARVRLLREPLSQAGPRAGRLPDHADGSRTIVGRSGHNRSRPNGQPIQLRSLRAAIAIASAAAETTNCGDARGLPNRMDGADFYRSGNRQSRRGRFGSPAAERLARRPLPPQRRQTISGIETRWMLFMSETEFNCGERKIAHRVQSAQLVIGTFFNTDFVWRRI